MAINLINVLLAITYIYHYQWRTPLKRASTPYLVVYAQVNPQNAPWFFFYVESVYYAQAHILYLCIDAK